ncbi:MAG: transposase [Planctomycetota bacterium]
MRVSATILAAVPDVMRNLSSLLTAWPPSDSSRVSVVQCNSMGAEDARHLDDLRRRLRRYRRIHVICDNAKFHDCGKVCMFLARWGHRIVIRFLPTYAPKTNPIERVWWHLHEDITRNHRRKTIDELVQITFDWFGYKSTFDIETSICPQAMVA